MFPVTMAIARLLAHQYVRVRRHVYRRVHLPTVLAHTSLKTEPSSKGHSLIHRIACPADKRTSIQHVPAIPVRNKEEFRASRHFHGTPKATSSRTGVEGPYKGRLACPSHHSGRPLMRSSNRVCIALNPMKRRTSPARRPSWSKIRYHQA